MTKVSLCDSPYCGEALWVNASCHHTLLDSRILAGVLIKRPRKRVTYSHMVAIVLLRLLRVWCSIFKIGRRPLLVRVYTATARVMAHLIQQLSTREWHPTIGPPQ